MPTSSQALLCRYHYDSLDRLAETAVLGEPDVLRFYQKSRLAIEIRGAVARSIVQHEDLLLAQQQGMGSTIATTLLATDQKRSVLQLLDATETHPLTYNPYGYLPADSGLNSLLGFNGERRDPVTGHYLLGNGYRAYNPVLMRFNSPDSLSPFGEGGINVYAYCVGDPVNRADPTGHSPFGAVVQALRFITKVRRQLALRNTTLDDLEDILRAEASGKRTVSPGQSNPITQSSASQAGSSAVGRATAQATGAQGIKGRPRVRGGDGKGFLESKMVLSARKRLSVSVHRNLLDNPLSDSERLAKITYQATKRRRLDALELGRHYKIKYGADSEYPAIYAKHAEDAERAADIFRIEYELKFNANIEQSAIRRST